MDKTVRVLLVQSNIDDQAAIENFISQEMLPYNYWIASSVVEALILLQAHSFELIITADLLKDGTVFDILRLTGDIPAIFITESGNEELVLKALREGAADFLIKGLDNSYLKLLPYIVGKNLRQKSNDAQLKLLEYIVGTSNDLSEQKEAESALKKSEERLRLITRSSNDALYDIDLANRLVWTNDAFKLLFGEISFDAPLINLLIQPEEALPNSRHYEGHSENEWSREMLMQDIKGESIYILGRGFIEWNEAGVMIRVAGALTNVTDYRNALKDIEENERKFRILTEKANAILWEADFVEKRIVYIGPQAVSIFGYTRREWLNNYFWENHLHPEDRTPTINLMNEMMYKNSDYEHEYRFIAADGRIVWIYDTVHILEDEQGGNRHQIGFMIDITKRKIAEEAQIITAKRLEGLHNLDRSILGEHSPQIITKKALAHIKEFANCQNAGVIGFDLKRSEASILGYQSDWLNNIVIGSQIPLNIFDIENLSEGSDLLLDDINSIKDRNTILYPKDVRSVLQVPLIRQDELLGVLWISSSVPFSISPYDQQIVHEVADLLAIAISQASLHEQIVTYSQELENRVLERTNELKRSKERLELIFHNSSDAIFLEYIGKGIAQINQAFITIFGCSERNCIGKNFIELASAESQAQLQLIMQEVLVNGITQQLEFKATRMSGDFFEAELSISSITDESGENGVVGIVRDITQRKQWEQQMLYHASLQNNVQEAVVATDASFKIRSWNKAAERIFGLKAEHAISRDFFEVFGEKSELLLRRYEILQQLEDKGNWNEEICYMRADEIEINLLSSIEVLENDEGEHIGAVCVSRDITARKRYQETLRKTTDQLQAIMDNSSAIIYVTDYDGNMLLLNRRYEELFIKDRSFSGKINLFDIYQTENARQYLENNRKVMELRKPIQFEEIVPQPDGIHIYLSIKSPLFDLDGKAYAICGVSTDITERKLMEEQLRENEAVLAEAQRMASIGNWSLDWEQKKFNWSEQAHRVLGYEQAIDIPDFNALINSCHSEDRQLLINAFEDVATNQVNFDGEIRFINPQGDGIYLYNRIKPIIKNGKVTHLFGTFQDITEQKAVEQALRESEERFKVLFEYSPDPLMLSTMDGIVLDVNNAFTELSGYSRFEAVEQPIVQLAIVSEDDMQLIRALFQKMEGTIAIPTLEVNFKRKDGVKLVVEIRAYKIHTRDNNYIFGSLYDITQRKEAEVSLRQALEKQKELTELKSRFVSTASHEFRTPLATIQAASDALQDYIERMNIEQVHRRVDKIHNAVKHMTQLLDDVLSISRIQEERVPFNPVLDDLRLFCLDIVDEIITLDENRHNFSFNAYDESLVTLFDRKLMRQVINNLMTNACKYSPVGSNIIFELARVNSNIIIKVKDFGIGIPEKDKSLLFDAFHRAANVGSVAGTGLGLTITLNAVEQHYGTISFESQVGEGSTFIVELPAFQV